MSSKDRRFILDLIISLFVITGILIMTFADSLLLMLCGLLIIVASAIAMSISV